jgi:hypothetical protein
LPEPISHPSGAAAPSAADRRTVWTLVAAAVVVVATVIVVLTVGIVSPPELAPVDAATRPDRALAVLAWREDARDQCLTVVGPDGSVREVRCALDGGGPLLGWGDEGIVLLRYAPLGPQLETIDPVDGTVVSRRPVTDAELQGLFTWDPPASGVRVGQQLEVRDADGRLRWTVQSPDSYGVTGAALDPGSGRQALLDSAGRLLVLAPEDSAPRVWVEDLGASYAEMVWEGTQPRGE